MIKSFLLIFVFLFLFACKNESVIDIDFNKKVNKLEFVYNICLDSGCTKKLEVSSDSCPGMYLPNLKLNYYDGLDSNDLVQFNIYLGDKLVYIDSFRYNSKIQSPKIFYARTFKPANYGLYYAKVLITNNGNNIWSGTDSLIVY